MKHAIKQPRGFTLVELIVAMALFSMMLLIISVGVLQIMKMYQSGLASRQTQQAARLALEDITREVRNSSTAIVPALDTLCLEGVQAVQYQVVNKSLQKVTGGSTCAAGTTTRTLIDGSGKIQVATFLPTLIPPAGTAASVKVVLTVTTGAADLLSGATCRPGTGSQYCSSTSYSNIISLRRSQ